MTTYLKKASRQELSVEELNDIFTPLPFHERIRLLYSYFPENEVLFTSSFGTKSVFLLYWVSQINPRQRVHFIDTTYHFPETIAYKKELTGRFHLDVIEVLPDPVQNGLTRDEAWWKAHPRMCCSINKVVPLEPITAQHKVWISGLMAYQTEFRANLHVFEKQGDIIKFHPLIDLDEGEFLYYMGLYDLPNHPLEDQGYGSVGCTHCTTKGEGRSGRWQGTDNKECGLHPAYFLNKQKR